jgi:hypothetical protein
MLPELQLDHYSQGIPAIALFVLAVIVCQIVVKRVLGHEAIRRCHEVGGYYLAIVGSFYAVLLGLVVFDALGKFEAAEKGVETEGKSLLAVSVMLKQFPQQEKKLETLLIDYLDEVVNVEWDLMENNQISKKARQDMMGLISEGMKIEPQTENQKALFPILAGELISAWEARRDRTRVTNQGVPSAEWAILLLGSVITITFTFFFTIESSAIYLLMSGMVALLISMSLYLVLMFGAPFSGDMRVSNSGLALIRDRIAEMHQADGGPG